MQNMHIFVTQYTVFDEHRCVISETFLTYYHLYIFNRKPDNSVAMSTGALQLHVQKQLV